MRGFRTEEDVAFCRDIHKRFGSTYYYSTLRFPEPIRWRIHGLYAFVRVPDEIVDNPAGTSIEERREALADWRRQLDDGVGGKPPRHPAMRVFCDLVTECGLPLEEANLFLDAMTTDLDRTRYETFDELRGYMRGSAAAVGVMMCYVMGADTTHDVLSRTCALGEAMQLTNFLRDVWEDYLRGRIYLPQEDLAKFGVREEDIERRLVTPEFRELMRFQIARARAFYALADPGIPLLPAEARKPVLLARILYAQILDRIEANGYDVYTRRARTTMAQKALWAGRVAWGSDRILANLGASLR